MKNLIHIEIIITSLLIGIIQQSLLSAISIWIVYIWLLNKD